MRRRRLSRLLPLWLASLVLAAGATAQAPEPEPAGHYGDRADSLAAAADTLGRSHPDRTPYVTRRSLLYRTLAAPAYLFHEAIRPVKWTVRWADRNGVFERIEAYYFRDASGTPAIRGIVPVVGIGGRAGVTGGIRAFHNDVFATGRKAGLLALWGGPGTYRVRTRFADPRLFGGPSLAFEGGYRADRDQTLYGVGNDATFDDRVRYRTTTLDAAGGLDLGVVGPFALFAEGEVDRTTTTAAEFVGGGVEVAGGATALADREGVEEASTMAFVGGGGRFDAVREEAVGLVGARPVAGFQLRVGYGYAQDVSGNAYGYHRLRIDSQTYLPIGALVGLPPNRRVVARLYLAQVRPNQGQTVPFYHLAALGGEDLLRGYRYQRFRDEGAILTSVAYLWPLHRDVDAVLFTEQGQVFRYFSDVNPGALHRAFGGGLRFYSRGRRTGRAEVVVSPEEVRVVLQIGGLL